MHRQSSTISAVTRFVCLAAVIGFAGLAGGGASAKATQIFGLFAVFKVSDLPKYRIVLSGLEGDLAKRGCVISLDGPVKKEQGDIGVRRPNRFVHIRCKRPLLRDRAGRALVLKLERAAVNLIALEGPLTLYPGVQSVPPRRARSYIFKVSHYNNLKPDLRESDLSAIDRIAAKRPDRYRTEGEIAVTDAIGIRRPDEVVILFYDRPEQGRRFRKNNPDILKRIGAFNNRHLTDFIYFITSSER